MVRVSTFIAAVAVCSIAGFMFGRIHTAPAESSFDAASETMNHRMVHRSGRDGAPMGPRASGSSSQVRRGFSGSGSSGLELGDPASRMGTIIGDPDLLNRTSRWLQFVEGIDSHEFEDIIVRFHGSGLAESHMSEYAMLLAAWASCDPMAAIDYASKRTDTPYAGQAVLTAWALMDPEGALRWAEGNHHGVGANPWMPGVIRGMVDADPGRANALMSAMPDSLERADALLAVSGYYLNQGPEAARSWASGIGDESLRSEAANTIFDVVVRADPEGTSKWLYEEGIIISRRGVTKDPIGVVEPSSVFYSQDISNLNLKGIVLEEVAQ